MKLSPYVKSVCKAYQSRKLLLEDILQLYKENYLNEIECKQVLSKGGNNGLRKL